MSQRERNVTIIIAACVAGLLGLAAMALPPFPIGGWFVAALLPSVDHWWYSLPDPQRVMWQYDLASALTTAVYPLLVALLFWLVARPLRRGDARMVRATAVFTGIGAGASLAWFIVSWRYGLQYQGLGTVLLYLSVSTVWLIVVFVCLRSVKRSESWWAHLALQFAAFAWLVTFAFPWLGEMI